MWKKPALLTCLTFSSKSASLWSEIICASRICSAVAWSKEVEDVKYDHKTDWLTGNECPHLRLCMWNSLTGVGSMVPEAFACAVSDSVSGPVSAPSCPVLGSRPWTSSFTVYTNNSIYKEITPRRKEREGGGERKKSNVTDAWLWPTYVMHRSSALLHFLKLPAKVLASRASVRRCRSDTGCFVFRGRS